MYTITPYRNRLRRNETGLMNLFDEFFNDSSASNTYTTSFNVDITENDDSYVFEAELPGVEKENVTLDYKDDTLVIKVVNEKTEEDQEDRNYIRRERRFVSMKRAFYLKDVLADQISAKLENGILTILAPKIVEEDKTFKIDIS